MQRDPPAPPLATRLLGRIFAGRRAGAGCGIIAAERLGSLGATFGPAPSPVSLGPAECARAALPPSPPNSAMVGVAARIAVLRDGITVRLKDPAGSVLDHLYCPPRAAPYDLAVFAAPAPSLTWHIGHITPQSAVAIESAACFSFTAGALEPARLMPRASLSDPSHWPEDPYAEPATEDAPARLRDIVFRGMAAPQPVQWLGGSQIFLEPGDEQSHCLFKYGLYEPESLATAVALLPRGGVFVDVGANSGLYTVLAATAAGPSGRVIAIEPSAREFRRLQANVALNRLANVRPVRAALADTPGEAALHIAEPHFSGHNTLAPHFAYGAVTLQAVETVPLLTLDSILLDEPRCDVIKMDIEGAELLALRGAAGVLEKFRPALLVEMNEPALRGSATSPAELAAWLVARRYTLHTIDARTGQRLAFVPPQTGHTCNILALPAP